MENVQYVNCSDSETVANDINITPCQKAASFLSNTSNPSSTEKRVVKRVLKLGEEDETDVVSSPKRIRCDKSCKPSNKDQEKTKYSILSWEVLVRLRNRFTLAQEQFSSFLSTYAHHKFISAMNEAHPYTIPKTFYQLFGAVGRVTHELFADAINESGVFTNFCSANDDDRYFGSVGSWESLENAVDGGVGHPLFERDTLLQILQTIHEQVATGRPYFRALVLPYEKGSPMYDLITHDSFGAEIVAVIEPELLSGWFIHHLKYFCFNHQKLGKSQVFCSPVCIAVWINEQYRRKYPPPLDVEDCFQEWEHNNFGPDVNVVDYNAVDNCFPERNRGGDIAVDLFSACLFCK